MANTSKALQGIGSVPSEQYKNIEKRYPILDDDATGYPPQYKQHKLLT